jgi:hypothetical protein
VNFFYKKQYITARRLIMKNNGSAFPIFDATRVGVDYECVDGGLTVRQYAAIHLKVPRSGDPELDAMIRESRRAEFAENVIDTAFCQYVAVGKKNPSIDEVVAMAYKIADVMLVEWEGEAGSDHKSL